MMRRRGVDLWIAAVAACLGCGHGAPPEETPAVARFELAGCAAVLRGPICEVTEAERTVRFHIPADAASADVSWRGAPLVPAATRTEGGTLLAVEVPAGNEAGQLVITHARAGSRAIFRLDVRRAEVEPRLARVRALRREGRIAEAIAAMPEPSAVPAAFAGRAASLRARLDLASGRTDAAITGLRAAMEIHRRDGRASDEGLDAMALAHTLISARRHAEARAVLAEARTPLADWDEGRAQIGYYRALLARDTGDLRSALRDLGETERASLRLGLGDMRRSARFVVAELLVLLNRHDEARALLRMETEAGANDENPCRRAELLATVGWIELIAPQPSRPGAEVTRMLGDALALHEERCPRKADLQNDHVNLALSSLRDGDLDSAERHAEAARRVGLPPAWIALWLLDLEGRIALVRGQGSHALARYDVLLDRARKGAAADAAWRALTGRGRALAALGRRPEAIAALREAEAVLDQRALAIPLDAGRAGFFGHHGESAAQLSELLIRSGAPAEAMRAVRGARARAIAAAERVERVSALSEADRSRWEEAVARVRSERDALDAALAETWELAADKLPQAERDLRKHEEQIRRALDDAFAVLGPAARGEERPPEEGELIVLYQALPGGPARVFAQDGRGVTTSPFEVPPPEATQAERSAALLAPIAEAIGRARRIRVLATGPILGVDVHALPFGDAPLVTRAPVVYALDLPGNGADRRGTPELQAGPRSALVVVDPRNDLRGARGEAQRIEARLGGAFHVTALAGDAADRASVLGALATARLFHFGGHGMFAGTTGWESVVALAGSGELSLGDVLALPAVPERVVLSGCETARAPDAGSVVDLSLANAFASAGSAEVVAAARPVSDALAAAMAEALYADVARPDWTLATALQGAQRAIAQEKPDLDWAAYRVVTR